MIKDFVEQFKDWAISFGAELNGVNSYLRENYNGDVLAKGGAFFGLVQETEGASGAYHDFSLVVFPDELEREWVVSFGIGSLGFRNDYDLAAKPGIRRRFNKLVTENGFIKPDFLDIESGLPEHFTSKVEHLQKTLNMYTKVLPVCEIVDPKSEDGIRKIKGFLALYADIRNWGSNKAKRNAIDNSIQQATTALVKEQDEVQVMVLLLERKYVVLQGAPGTGKTRLSKMIAEDLNAVTFFTQFHAETSYSDFVWGIKPSLQTELIRYQSCDGILIQAIKFAINNPERKVVLIIDEINRANLSNVLGPVFYLFEYMMEKSKVSFAVTDDLAINQLPENFYVIATMNTADRSLAVVDFALRRRFAWYTLWPKSIPSENFHVQYFERISKIFEMNASDEELNLQPGQGCFIADNDAHMKKRIKYEIMPLIKEYLVEGLLSTR